MPKLHVTDMYNESDQMSVDRKRAELGITQFLEALGLDLKDPNYKDTPKRVVKMYADELFVGLTQDPPDVTTFPLKEDKANISEDLIFNGPIKIRSTCGHHLMPITGHAYVGVLANPDSLPGLSKYARIVHHYAQRPQLQEKMTQQIVNHLMGIEGINSAAVSIKAKHFCMCHRGVKEDDAYMITTSLEGSFKKFPELRAEFLSYVRESNG